MGILKVNLGFESAELGFFLSVQFAFGGFVNGFLLGPLTRFFGSQSRIVIRNCLACTILGYAFQATLCLELLAPLFQAGLGKTCLFIGALFLLTMFQYAMSTSI